MKIQKQTIGTIRPHSLPAIKNRVCPSCNCVGEFETDENLNVYCQHCGLVIETPYPYDAGLRHWTYADFIYYKRIRELKKKWTKKKKR